MPSPARCRLSKLDAARDPNTFPKTCPACYADRCMRRAIVVFLASGAYLGYAPVASGTFGTLAGVALYPVFDGLRLFSVSVYLLSFAGLVAAAVILAGEA